MRTLARPVMPSIAVAILLLCPAFVSAQEPDSSPTAEPRVGEQLVVTYVIGRLGPQVYNYRKTVHLEFVALDGGLLVGREGGGLVSIDTAAIRTVERRIGTKPASAPAMAMGSAAGFATGFLIGAMVQSRSRAWSPNTEGRMSSVNRGLATGVLVGAPVGALVAWVASRSRPIYEAVQIGRARPSVAMKLSGRMRFSVSIATP